MASDKSWESMHKEANRPWSLEKVTPALQFFVDQGLATNDPKTILIPGCGQHHDTLFLAESFPQARHVIGLDLSETAVENCRKMVQSNQMADNVSFESGDFFVYQNDSVDFVFDYTFFCAIPMQMREAWGRKMGEIIRPDGYLLTLMYPMAEKEDFEEPLPPKPPFPVCFAAYSEVLTEFSVVKRWPQQQQDEKKSDCFPASNSNRQGREELVLWQRNK